MTKKHLLFALIVCMSTVWRLLELLEYGEIEVRQVDTYMYFGRIWMVPFRIRDGNR